MKNPEANHFGLSFLLAFFKIGVVIGAAGVLLGFLGRHHWLMDLMAQLRIQWAIGLLVLFVLFSVFQKKKWTLACFIIFMINFVPMWPNMIGSTASSSLSPNPQNLRLMSLNVLTPNPKKSEVITTIQNHRPDVVILMEVDTKWENAVRAALFEVYPHIAFQAREDNFGIALLSKTPWDRLEIFNSPPANLPSIDVVFAGPQSETLRIIATHPLPPLGQQNWEARNIHLMEVAKRVNETDPTVIIGDFNLTPWSPIFKDLLKTSGLTDRHSALALTPTWDVFPTWLGALKIDHALVSKDIQMSQFVQKVEGSDHRALVLDIQY